MIIFEKEINQLNGVRTREGRICRDRQSGQHAAKATLKLRLGGGCCCSHEWQTKKSRERPGKGMEAGFPGRRHHTAKFKRGKERPVHFINYREFMQLAYNRLGGG